MPDMNELHNLPALEKLKIIEMLWADLACDEAALPDMSWHEDKLRETQEKYEAGAIEVLDWQSAKSEMRSRFE